MSSGRPNMDQMVRRGAKPLFLHEHLFIELLAGAQAGIADLDIHIRLKAGKADKVAGQIVNADRLAHIQHENLAAAGISARSQHEGVPPQGSS